jgi:hypothetical protein
LFVVVSRQTKNAPLSALCASAVNVSWGGKSCIYTECMAVCAAQAHRFFSLLPDVRPDLFSTRIHS